MIVHFYLVVRFGAHMKEDQNIKKSETSSKGIRIDIFQSDGCTGQGIMDMQTSFSK